MDSFEKHYRKKVPFAQSATVMVEKCAKSISPLGRRPFGLIGSVSVLGRGEFRTQDVRNLHAPLKQRQARLVTRCVANQQRRKKSTHRVENPASLIFRSTVAEIDRAYRSANPLNCVRSA
jgi:hypothetical protein